jgi:hypothetical protein
VEVWYEIVGRGSGKKLEEFLRAIDVKLIVAPSEEGSTVGSMGYP